MVHKIKYGNNIPTVNDLAEKQLGYCRANKCLYTKDNGEIIQVSVSLEAEDELAVSFFNRNISYYKRVINSTYNATAHGLTSSQINNPDADKFFDLEFINDGFVFRYIGCRTSGSGNIATFGRTTIPNQRVTFFSPEFWVSEAGGGLQNNPANFGGSIQTNKYVWKETDDNTNFINLNDAYGVLCANEEIDDKYLYFHRTGNLYRIFNWVTGFSYNISTDRSPYEIIIYIQKILRKFDDKIVSGSIQIY